MKIIKISGFILLLICVLAAGSFGQSKWIRIETDDFSVSLPPGFLVDAEKHDNDVLYKLFGFQNGVVINFRVFKESDPKGRLQRILPGTDSSNASYTKEAFGIRRISAKPADRDFSESIYFASKKNFYHLSVRSRDRTAPEIGRVLFSIRLNGKPMFVQSQPYDFDEEFASVRTLQSTPEIIQLWARKIEKTKGEYKIEALKNLPEPPDFKEFSRPPVIVDKPIPGYRPDITLVGGSIPEVDLLARLRVTFLANGQIGEITAYSNAERFYVNSCVEAARKIKFIPAQRDGKNVDSVDIIEYRIQTMVVARPGIITSRPLL